MANSMDSKLHIAMFPWLAYGHIIPYLKLANDIAKLGHKISFLLPKSAHLKLAKSNLHPQLIILHPLSVPNIEGLPRGVETTSDTDETIPLSAAMDAMKDQVKAALVSQSRPDFVIFDFADWVPVLVSEIGCKALFFSVISPTIATQTFVKITDDGRELTPADVIRALPKYPSSNRPILRENEARAISAFANQKNNKMKGFYGRLVNGAKQSDVIAVRSCVEIEGAHCEHLSMQYGKPVLCTGPLLPEPGEEEISVEIVNWLERFDSGSVVFCVFGSEIVLEIPQLHELVLGLELAGLPFLIVGAKPPKGMNSIREALPEGFQERIKENGVVHEGWVPQTLILRHRSIGCFVCHGGSASMWESLASDCRIVVVPPNRIDYTLNARLLAEELVVAVQVERGENVWFSKESLGEAIKSAMDQDSEVGVSLKENHKKWRDLLLSPGFADNYIAKFIQKLYDLLGK